MSLYSQLVFSPKISSHSCTSGTRGTSPSTPYGSLTTGPAVNTDARPLSSWTCTTGRRPADSRIGRRPLLTLRRSPCHLRRSQCIFPLGYKKKLKINKTHLIFVIGRYRFIPIKKKKIKKKYSFFCRVATDVEHNAIGIYCNLYIIIQWLVRHCYVFRSLNTLMV